MPWAVIKISFQSCAFSLPVDGANDEVIQCYKEGQQYSTVRAIRRTQLGILREAE